MNPQHLAAPKTTRDLKLSTILNQWPHTSIIVRETIDPRRVKRSSDASQYAVSILEIIAGHQYSLTDLNDVSYTCIDLNRGFNLISSDGYPGLKCTIGLRPEPTNSALYPRLRFHSDWTFFNPNVSDHIGKWGQWCMDGGLLGMNEFDLDEEISLAIEGKQEKFHYNLSKALHEVTIAQHHDFFKTYKFAGYVKDNFFYIIMSDSLDMDFLRKQVNTTS